MVAAIGDNMRLMASGIVGNLDPGSWGVPTGSGDLINVIKTAITTAYSFAGVAAIAFMIYGGYKVIISRGDPQKLKEGQDALVNAVVGLVIIVTTGVLFNFIAIKLGVGNIITVLSIPIQ